MRPPVKHIGMKYSSNFVIIVYRDGKPPDPLILQPYVDSPLCRSYLLRRLVFRENSMLCAVLMPCDLSECSDHGYVPFSHLIMLSKYLYRTA
jgi:hypothetical protein